MLDKSERLEISLFFPRKMRSSEGQKEELCSSQLGVLDSNRKSLG